MRINSIPYGSEIPCSLLQGISNVSECLHYTRELQNAREKEQKTTASEMVRQKKKGSYIL
jgi:hypothetical protein